ncbi:hypothetical protein PV10_06751 [Exophiala mesophila]|uniref:AMP-dependent synthetase/ligase domain-containing protein n=1 Tax=Exophiala mesophila TaxID=212818 RepID=A0A0D1ZEC3_EXOME|nr:uncharacterized protein PV10_06751 [Exophiala mesophila]KIV92299.1 hypothetical protein PV10_06751 [Exophiala mesophila]
MEEPRLAEKIDAILADFFSSWNLVSTVLVLLVIGLLTYPLLTSKDPDTHPFLLARQAQVAPVRHSGESAVYRAIDIPHGYPLRAGLGVKDPGTPRWSAGRPGDLRDIWRRAVSGSVKEDGTPTGEKGKIQTVLGRERIIDHDFADLTLDINVIGQHIKRNNGQSVAVCLSNSVELLSSIFAGSFYGFSTTLLPHGVSTEVFKSLLSKTTADYLIADAGTIDLDDISSANKSIKNIIWVSKAAGQHIDWTEKSPRGFSVTSWKALVDENKATTNSEVLPLDKDSQVPPVSIFTPISATSYDVVKYTSENLISATAALLATLPRTHKLSTSDTVLSTLSFTNSYPLAWALAALYSNATLSINSVAGDGVPLDAAVSLARPSILITSPTTITNYLKHPSTIHPSGLAVYTGSRSLRSGNLPSSRGQPSSAMLSNLRAVFIPQHIPGDTSVTSSSSSRLTSSDLSTLRLTLTARVGYALTTPLVAGAVTQTNILDYRDKGKDVVMVGAPLSSVEIHLEGEEEFVGTQKPSGRLAVKGPVVVGGGKVVLDAVVRIDDDHTIILS